MEVARDQRAEGASSERTRLSRDIHDGIAQGFSSIVLLARAARTEEDPQRVRELLAHLEDGATRGLEESRRVVAALAPADLDALEGAARAYVPVDSPVILSPFTGRADGERHPELVPQRTSERLLASSISSFLIAAVVAIVLLTVFE